MAGLIESIAVFLLGIFIFIFPSRVVRVLASVAAGFVYFVLYSGQIDISFALPDKRFVLLVIFCLAVTQIIISLFKRFAFVVIALILTMLISTGLVEINYDQLSQLATQVNGLASKIQHDLSGDNLRGIMLKQESAGHDQDSCIATVNTDRGIGLNIRANTSTDSKIVGHAAEGAELQVLQTFANGWTEIIYHSVQGYVISGALKTNC